MDGRFFSFRSSGIIQKAKPMEEQEDKTATEHVITSDDIFIPSDEVIDFSNAKTESKDALHNVVDLEDAKVIDREKEGILEFDTQGSVIQEKRSEESEVLHSSEQDSKKKRPKIKRVTTIRDYVKKLDEKETAMDYIDIDDDEPSKRVFTNDKEPKKESEEPLPDLDYIPYDDEEDEKREEGVGKPAKKEEGPMGTIDCPHCSETIEIQSSKRPITLKCPGCGKKGVLRI